MKRLVLLFSLTLILGFSTLDAFAEEYSELLPVDDAYIVYDISDPLDKQSFGNLNTGQREFLHVLYANNTPDFDGFVFGVPYLKFDLSGIDLSSIERMELVMFPYDINRHDDNRLIIFLINDNTWSELTLTHNNRSIINDNPIGSLETLKPNNWYSWDVTASIRQLKNHQLSFALLYENYYDETEELITFYSKEAGKDKSPFLKIYYKNTTDDKNANQFYNESQNHLMDGNHETALKLINKSLEIDPVNAKYLAMKGKILIEMEQFEKARILLEEAYVMFPENGEILNKLGTVYVKLNMPVDALISFSESSKVDPEMTEIALSNYELIRRSVTYYSVDGTLDIIIHDSEKNLLGHVLTRNLTALDHDVTDWALDEWPLKEIITKNGQKYEIRERTVSFQIDNRYFGQSAIQETSLPNVFTFFAHHNGVITESGDQITSIYTISRPLN